MNELAIVRHPIFKEHENSPGHPESPERLTAIDRAVESHKLREKIIDLPPRLAELEEILRIHSEAHVQQVAGSASRERTDFDWETGANSRSFEAARYAAGAVIAAVDAVLATPDRPVYAIVRPPGHHAEKSRVMGFCLFNNVAIAAEHAIAARGLKRVMIFDWDVHHGNGTMHSFYERSDVLYVSAHQFPHYPGTGNVTEIGEAEGRGHTINFPLPPGSTDTELRYAIEEVLVPVMKEYKPELVIVSAGFDGHTRDRLSSMYLSSRMYADMALLLRSEMADTHAGLVLALEGGYDLPSLEDSNSLLIEALCGAASLSAPSPEPADQSAVEVVEKLKALLAPYWRCFAR